MWNVIVILLTGANVMTPRFGRGMATLAQRHEIIKLIGFLPVMREVSPGRYVVNIKRATELLLCSAALLAGVIVALAGGALLFDPVWTAPLLISALPVGMILALLPIGGAFVRAKAFVFAAFNYMRLYFNSLTALTASKETVTAFSGAGAGTAKSNIRFIGDNIKRLFAYLTGFSNASTARKVLTFLGAEYLCAVVGNKFFSALLAVRFHGSIIPHYRGRSSQRYYGI